MYERKPRFYKEDWHIMKRGPAYVNTSPVFIILVVQCEEQNQQLCRQYPEKHSQRMNESRAYQTRQQGVIWLLPSHSGIVNQSGGSVVLPAMSPISVK